MRMPKFGAIFIALLMAVVLLAPQDAEARGDRRHKKDKKDKEHKKDSKDKKDKHHRKIEKHEKVDFKFCYRAHRRRRHTVVLRCATTGPLVALKLARSSPG